jgi:two-component system, OmpR family, response regulator ChvI
MWASRSLDRARGGDCSLLNKRSNSSGKRQPRSQGTLHWVLYKQVMSCQVWGAQWSRQNAGNNGSTVASVEAPKLRVVFHVQGTSKQSAAELPSYVGGADALRILCVEDDEHYRETLVVELSERGFAVQGFADATSLLGWLDSVFEADVIVLEWKLPKISGVDLLRQLRRRGVNLPVVFLTGHTLAANECLAFDKGATDFIDKTRGVDVLVSRLKRIVGLYNPIAERQADKFIACGKLLLKTEISRTYWNGVDVGLTVGEYKIVHLLATSPGRYVTYRAIYDRLTYEGFIAGAGNTGYRANVRSAIKRIRNKFRACDPGFVEIENCTAFGYCWAAPQATQKQEGRAGTRIRGQRGLAAID